MALVVLALIGSNSTRPGSAASAPKAPPVAPSLPKPVDAVLGQMVEWDAGKIGSPALYRADDLSITLSAAVSASSADPPRPVIRIEVPNGTAQEFEGPSGFSTASARFGVGRFSSSAPSGVLFMAYTGGAHCCTTVRVFEREGPNWDAVDLGSWDGEPLSQFPTDVNGDGAADFLFSDDRFLYTFSSYADSWSPPVILNIRDGRAVDVSTAPGYAALYMKHLEGAMRACLQHSNGGCAGFVADAARLGRAAWAWKVMLENFDAKSDWTLPKGCSAATDNDGKCPPGNELVFATYPDALLWFLKSTGYVAQEFIPDVSEPPTPEVSGESGAQ